MKTTITKLGKCFAVITYFIIIGFTARSADPTIDQKAPGGNVAIMRNTKLTFRVEATDKDGRGNINRVEFYRNGSFLGNGTITTISDELKDNSAIYYYEFSNTTAESYEIKAKAFDAQGGSSAFTYSVTITVHPDDVSSNKIYYVQPREGSGNGAGTQADPYRRLQYASDQTLPGDQVVLLNASAEPNSNSNATYFNNTVTIRRTGRAGKPVIYRSSDPTNRVLIKFNGWGCIEIRDGVSYIEVRDIRVQGNNSVIANQLPEGSGLAAALKQPGACITNNPEDGKYSGSEDGGKFNGNGINIIGALRFNSAGITHHITVSNNEVFECGSGGVVALGGDYLTITDNVIYRNCWYTIYGGSGISLLDSDNFDNSTATKNFILRNRAFDNQLFVPWESVCVISDGNGIIIDTNKTHAYTGRTLVADNVVWYNGGSGIQAFNSQHVDIVNNTGYQNSQTKRLQGEILASFSDDVNIINNIMYTVDPDPENGGQQKATETYSNGIGYSVGPAITAAPVTYNYNLIHNTTNILGKGANDISKVNNANANTDPLFVNAGFSLTADFNLKSGSPAINAGSNTSGQYYATDIIGTTRPEGTRPDIGAYEFKEQVPPTGGSNGANLITNSTFNSNTTGWDLYQYAPAAATVVSASQTGYTDNVAKTTITNAGTESWNIQLRQALPLKAGETYSIKFKASAAAARTIDYTFQQNEGAKTIWNAQYGIALTPTPTTYGPFAFTCNTTDASNQFNFLLGASTTAVYIDDVEITVIAANLIANPTFNTNTTAWTLYQYNATASLASSAQTGYTSNVAKTTITNGGTESWNVQLNQAFPLKAGETYALKFKASADAARTIGYTFQQNEGAKTIWNSQYNMSLTTTPTTYGPFTFTCNTTDASNQFNFLLGASTTAVYIDDVEITVISTNLIANPTFNTNTIPWTLYQYTATASVASASQAGYDSNVAKTTITNGGTESWNVQLSQALPLKAGETYSIKFKASAAAARTIDYTFQQNEGAKTIWNAQYGIALTSSPTTYGPFAFTCNTTDASNQFNFLLGASTTAVYIDDVEITVISAVTGVIVSPTTVSLSIAATQQLTPTVGPSAATNKSVTWSSSNPAVATVNTSGLVTAIATGIATITVTTVDGGKTATTSVAVNASTGGDGLKGEYYNAKDLSGSIAVTRTDATINFDWGTGSYATSQPVDNFSARWTGQVLAKYTETYTFETESDDGVRLWVNDVQLVNKWIDQGPTKWTGTISLTAGTKYYIKMEYYENGGGAVAILRWSSASQAYEVIPQSQLFSTSNCTAEGKITYQKWNGISGAAVADLTSNANYPNTPSTTTDLTSFESASDVSDNFGARIAGYICAPQTGGYTIWIAGDDNVELWLSTNNQASGKVKIASHTGWTNSREWNKYTTQKSGIINLTAGQSYYVEALMKEAAGGDNLAVGWRKPNDGTGTTPTEVIPGTVLSRLIGGAPRLETEDQNVLNDIAIYPNPTTGEFQIEFTNEGSAEVIITNPSGQSIVNFKRVGNINEKINLSSYGNGLYLLRVQNNKGIKTKKIVIGK